LKYWLTESFGSPGAIPEAKMNKDYLQFVNKEIQKFKTPELRDLAWVIAAPPLFDSFPENEIELLTSDFFEKEFTRILPRLTSLDKNPTDLLSFIHNGNTKLLGKYFEALIKYWLMKFSNFKVIRTNVQIFKNKRTIGELDFLIKDKVGGVIHLETAGKYYISAKGTKEWRNFYGPNPADNLSTKIEKMLNEQIKLSSEPSAKSILKSLGINTQVRHLIIFKGFFYYPWNEEGDFTPAYGASKNHLYGYWIKVNEAEQLLSGKDYRWTVLQRREWISRRFFIPPEKTYTTEQLVELLSNYFLKNNYPLLIAKTEANGNYFIEIERIFVISPDWPNFHFRF
jgi:hypothetical protein